MFSEGFSEMSDYDEEMSLEESTPAWTKADQRRVDAFEQQILAVATQPQSGHPNAIVFGLAQAVGSLMRLRLRDDPTQLPVYQRVLEMLTTHVTSSVLPDHAEGTKH